MGKTCPASKGIRVQTPAPPIVLDEHGKLYQLASYNSRISGLWVQMRDSDSISQGVINQGKPSVNLWPPHTSTRGPIHRQTHIHLYLSYTLTYKHKYLKNHVPLC